VDASFASLVPDFEESFGGQEAGATGGAVEEDDEAAVEAGKAAVWAWSSEPGPGRFIGRGEKGGRREEIAMG